MNRKTVCVCPTEEAVEKRERESRDPIEKEKIAEGGFSAGVTGPKKWVIPDEDGPFPVGPVRKTS